MLKKRKAQAASEFLATYGWAILIVMAALTVIVWFGFLKPERYFPDSCLLIIGVSCEDFKVDGVNDVIAISVRNSGAEKFSRFEIVIGDEDSDFCEGDAMGDTILDFTPLDYEEAKTITVPCRGIQPDSGVQFKADLYINYQTIFQGTPELEHTKVGVLTTIVE